MSVTLEERTDTLKMILYAFIDKPPETKEEFIEAVHTLNMLTDTPRMPTQAVYPGAESPADILWDIYCGQPTIWEAGRGTYKTIGMAIIAWLLFSDPKTKIDLKWLAGSGDQAKNGWKYLAPFIMDTPTRDMVKGEVRKEKVEMHNRSQGGIQNCSQTSVRGGHPTAYVIDEVDEVPWSIMQAAFGGMQRARVRGLISTSHNPGGTMSILAGKAPIPGTDTIQTPDEWGYSYRKTTALESMLPCREDCSECKAALKPTPEGDSVSFYDFCLERARDADGFLTRDQVLDVWRGFDYRHAVAEMFCEGALAHGLVYYAFNPSINVRECEYDPSLPVYAGWDFGYENPTICLLVQIGTDDQVRVIDEGRWNRADVIPARLAENFRELCRSHGFSASEVTCKGDPAAASEMAALRAEGVQVYPAKMRGTVAERVRKSATSIRGRNTAPVLSEEKGGVRGSVMLVNKKFEMREDGKPGMVIDPRCTGLIRELGTVQYKEGTDEIKKVDDHGPDALRYGLWPLLRLKETGGSASAAVAANDSQSEVAQRGSPRVPSVSGLGNRNRRLGGSF